MTTSNMDWEKMDIVARYKPNEVITGPFAHHLIRQCGLADADGTSDIKILDIGCGTGVVTLHLYEYIPAPARARMSVVCGDFEREMVDSVKTRIEENDWKGAETKVLDASKLDLPDNHFTHVLAAFVLFLVPDPRVALAECRRVLQPGATLAATFFKSVGWYPLAAAAITRIPGAPPLPPFARFMRTKDDPEAEWNNPAHIEARVRDAGFVDVRVELYAHETPNGAAEPYVKHHVPFMKNVFKNFWSKEEIAQVSPHFEAALLEATKEKYGDGEVVLQWEAYCVTAKKS